MSNVFGHLVKARGSACDVDSVFVSSAEKHVGQPFGHFPLSGWFNVRLVGGLWNSVQSATPTHIFPSLLFR